MSKFKMIAKIAARAVADELWKAVQLFYYGILLGAGALTGAGMLMSFLP